MADHGGNDPDPLLRCRRILHDAAFRVRLGVIPIESDTTRNMVAQFNYAAAPYVHTPKTSFFVDWLQARLWNEALTSLPAHGSHSCQGREPATEEGRCGGFGYCIQSWSGDLAGTGSFKGRKIIG